MAGEMIRCTACGNEFDSAKIKLKKHLRSDGLTELYYHCPKCQHCYLVCLHNNDTLELQRRINRLDRRGKIDAARKLRLDLKQKLDRLNGK